MKRYALTFVLVLAACGGGSSTPAVVPPAGGAPSSSPASTPTPAGAPDASPASLAFTSGSAQTLTITETGYGGSFTESDTCDPYSGAIAAVSTGAKSAGTAAYVVAPLAAGTCTITVTDASGHAAAVSVSVSTAAITVQ